MKITGLKTNHITNPLGYDIKSPVLSFVVEESTGKKLSAARIRISKNADLSNPIYDSGMSEEISSLGHVPADGLKEPLEGGCRYYWNVEATADNGDCGLSETAWFEGGRKETEWNLPWIASPFDKEEHPVMGKTFQVKNTAQVVAARLYIAGLGLYEAYLNGSKVGDEYLTPHFNDYRFWVQYGTYDVTGQICEGENKIAVMLGNGWYKGRFGYEGDGKEKELYGNQFLLSAELVLTYADGHKECIVTDDSWKCRKSPVRFSNIYDGEIYDASVCIWDETEDVPVVLTELPADIAADPKKRVCERLSLPVCIHEQLPPTQLIVTPKGEQLIDFGQEITGWVEFDYSGQKTDKIFLQYSEIMQEDCFYRDNLRTALAEFTYIPEQGDDSGATDIVHVRPHFTFYGFRYVKVEGIDLTEENLTEFNFRACVLYSDLERTGYITTSNEKLNRLIENTVWGQKGNFLDVPTDCPQRDERCGWTGDAQIFCATASYHMYTPAFYRKYLKDMLYEQQIGNGAVPYVVPDILSIFREHHGRPEFDLTVNQWGEEGSCAWGDAATVIPWTLYQFYGDKQLLEETYPNMKAWTDFIIYMDENHCGGGRLWNVGFHFADWLALDNPDKSSCFGKTDPYFVASVYYMYSAQLTAKAARVLGNDEDAAYYEKIAAEVKQAIRDEYITKTGRVATDTQTAQVLAIYFDLVPEAQKGKVAKELKRKLMDKNMHLDTGFVGTGYLCKALTKAGMSEDAWTLLFQEDYPSWLYEVNMGATTVWERWNSVLPDGSISDTGMNSLNHYSYGAVSEWIYRTAVGLAPDESVPGFKKAIFAPAPDKRLGFANASYDSASGTWKFGWEYTENDDLVFTAKVPFDCEGTFVVPEGYQLSGLYYLGNGEDLSAQKMESDGQACLEQRAARLDSGWWRIVAKKAEN